MLEDLQVQSEDILEMLQHFQTLAWSGQNARKAVCDWMVKNEAKWSPFVPQGFPKVTEVVGVSSGVRIAFVLLGITGICFCVLILVWLHKKADHPIVTRSQPLFLRMIVVGGMLMNVLVILVAQEPSDVVCILQPWIGHMGFLMLVMPLLVKSWRVAVFFNNKKLKNLAHINNSYLVRTLSVIGGALIVYLLIWTVVAPPKLKVASTGVEDIGLHASDKVREITVCSSPEPTFAYIAFVFEFLQLLWGVSLCVQLSGVPSEFSESTYIALGIYNTTLITTICGALIYSFDLDPDPQTLLTGSSLFFSSNVMLLLVFLPKILRANKANSRVAAEAMTMATASTLETKMHDGTNSPKANDKREPTALTPPGSPLGN
jgi:hypothetical protein